MTSIEHKTTDALAHAARDISRHIAGLSDELLHLHHGKAGDTALLVDRTLDKIRDQIALLTAVVDDLARAEHQT
jgi:hypothetical protein